MQGLVLCIVLGMITTTAGVVYMPSLLITLCSQLIYGFVLHRRGVLAKKEENDIDLGYQDPDILSNYIKIV